MKKFDPSKKKIKKPEGSFVVEGFSAVSEYLKFSPSSIEFVVCKSPAFQTELLSSFPLCSLRGDQWLSPKSPSLKDSDFHSHSPVWASVKVKTKTDVELFSDLSLELGSKPQSVLVLDHITDPRNLGAVMRTAAFYGIRHVIAPKDRQVLLTGASVATAQGAFALVDLYVVTNLSRTIEELKKRSFWVLGTSLKGKSMDLMTEIGAEDNLVFVLGSEEKGLSRGIEKACDWLVLLESVGESLQSLNVSVAAGVFCDRLTQLRKHRKKA